MAYNSERGLYYCTTTAILNQNNQLVCPFHPTCPNLRNGKIDPSGVIYCTTTPSTALADSDDPTSVVSICTDPSQSTAPALPCFITTLLQGN